MTLAARPPIALLPTRDAERARAFFEGTLGLACKEVGPYALVFDLAGVELRVTPVGDFTPQPFTVLGWAVPDLRATVTELSAKQVPFQRYPGLEQDDLGIWFSGQAHVAWFKDPDGNTLSLTQYA